MMKTSWVKVLIGAGVVLIAALSLNAQDPQPAPPDVLIHAQPAEFAWATPVPAPGQGPSTFTFVAAHAGMEGEVVKDKPYQAEAVTETSRTLGDGTKIERKSTSRFYRDSQGRTRREQTLGAVGPWAAADAPKTIFIHDPVKGEMYVLNPDEKTAQKTVVHVDVSGDPVSGAGAVVALSSEIKAHKRGSGAEAHATHEQNVWVEHSQGSGGDVTIRRHEVGVPGKRAFFMGHGDETKEEPLGERMIEGVLCQGKRVTSIIPEGKIGNDRPIEIVHETWYSNELQATVLSKTLDPMNGDITYRLTQVQRGDPPASVFDVPADYRIEETGRREIKIHRSVTSTKEPI